MNQYEFKDLSDKNKKIVEKYMSLIDFDDDNLYLSYGVSTQRESQIITQRISKTSESKENDRIIDLVNELNEKLIVYNKKKERKESFFGFLMKGYEDNELTFRKEMEEIKIELENHKMILVRKEVLLGKLKNDTSDLYNKMNNLIVAGKEKISLAENNIHDEDKNKFFVKVQELHKSNLLNLQQEAQINYLASVNIKLQGKIEENINDIEDMLEKFK